MCSRGQVSTCILSSRVRDYARDWAIVVDVDEAIKRGLLAKTTGDLSRLIGRPTTPLAESVAAAVSAGM